MFDTSGLFAHEKRAIAQQCANYPYSNMTLLERMEYADEIETLIIHHQNMMNNPMASKTKQNLHAGIYFHLQAEKKKIGGNG